MRAVTHYISFFLLFWCPFVISAQCTVGADAGDDILVCADDNTTTLNGNASGANLLGFSWSPTAGLSDPNSLTPTVFLTGVAQTYTLTSQGFNAADNLITNGDFEAGNTAFTTEYVPGTGGVWGPLSDEGQFEIDNNAQNTHSNFASCSDHTGGGNMMVVNGSSSLGDEVWCQVVTVTPGTDYAFSAWATSVVGDNPARLQFSINGNLIGSTFNVSGAVCNWQEFNELWNSGGSSSAEICLVNQNTASGGNDFALDDIFFGEVCEATDEVNIDLVSVAAVAPSPLEIPCEGELTIDGSASTGGADVFYNWSTPNGNILSGLGTPMITVNAPGDYTLEVVFDDGNAFCADEVVVTVTDDLPTAVAVASATGTIDCATPTLQLSGAGSSTGSGWTYSWTTTDGNIIDGDDTLTPTVDAGGTYELVVFNPVSGCTDIAQVIVGQVDNAIMVDIALPDTLTCDPTPVGLDGSGSSAGANITYNWTTAEGNILAGTTGPLPIVNAPGTYVLTVEDNDTGCIAQDSVEVAADRDVPPLTFNLPDTITCRQDTAILVAQSGAGVTYAWSTDVGIIGAGQGSDRLVALAAGDYFLTVRDTISGCTSTDTVSISDNLTAPIADAGATDTLTCGALTAQLDGTNSSSGMTFAYAWTTQMGNIVSGAGTQVPVVDAAGSYFLEVINQSTGCSARDTVLLASNDEAPVATIAAVDTLNCVTISLPLNASGSSFGPGFTFAWSTTDGSFLSGQQTLTPQVSAAGTYTLTVTDTVNTCQTVRSVTVVQDTLAPTVVAGPDFRLDCQQPTGTLNSSGSDIGPDFSFGWSSVDGDFVDSPTLPNPAVDGAGVYLLTITDTGNGCTATDSVLVTASFFVSPAIVGPDTTLNCRDTLLTLGQNAFDPAQEYTWTTPNGSIVGANMAPSVVVDAAGLYRLEIINPDNGCLSVDSINVAESFTLPTVTIAPPPELNCTNTTTFLNAAGSSAGNPFVLSWLTDGTIIAGGDGLTPTIAAPGRYRLLIENTTNFCVDSAVVDVMGNFDFPTVEAGDSSTVNCRFTTATLSAAGSDTGNNFSLLWTTTDGNILGDPTAVSPVVDAPGTYVLNIRNTANDCVARDTVMVGEDIAPPPIDAGPNLTLTCDSLRYTLGRDTFTPGFRYVWFSFTGNVTEGSLTPQATVDAPGLYTLMVTNTLNGCESRDNVTIGQDITPPEVSILEPAVLNCRDTIINLTGEVAAGLEYNWTTVGGAFGGTVDQAVSMVTGPGAYQLEVRNPANGCRRTAAVTVTQNTAPPVFSLAPAAALTCLDPEQSLQADAGSSNLTYAWTTATGNLTTGAGTAQPTVDAPGVYVLTVTDPTNFCLATDSLEIAADTMAPQLTIAPPAILTCAQRSVDLAGQTDLSPVAGTILWTTNNGQLASGETTLTPSVTAPGTYRLLLTDPTNGCATEGEVTVTENITPPQVDLVPTVDLGCTEADFALVADAMGTGTLTFSWATETGTVVSGGTTAAPVINGPGRYTLVVTDLGNGCVDSAAVLADQNLLLDFEFTQRNPNCTLADATLQFGSVDGGMAPFTYSVDAGASFRSDPVFQGLIPDNYVLVVRDAAGCEVERGTSVVPAPDFELTISDNALIDFGDFYQIDARINFPLAEVDTVIWTPTEGLDCTDCLNPRAAPQETQSYRIRVETVDGCVAESFLTIIVNEENPVFFPTAFSPNGDGINDAFVPFASLTRVARITSMQIFDRWGESVFFNQDFAPNDLLAGWDGTLNGKLLNAQVLAYAVEVEFLNGERRLFKGDVTLLR